ncbi:biotin--[acetyl-CoA-carboxylase] ligase [Hymenobacter guriensis]|uniref:Biotin--[acetyl-CoA-carboxylase] ligase n=1 Tax=Hymenobacter guriensis TaxID=2793065 RepID=A0ABS0KY67_9BACT|nr:biotin--[acetyl-CoA-carboxylase] ligase [Hymenobacter guriensis]MBG8552783.1 biotin--[acetyl-CoA-carboxylase] ligase [Hymenobacter guriensis]
MNITKYENQVEALHPKTLFTGQQVIWLAECASTNTEAHDLLLKSRATEGCVVLTDKQTAGRGQRGNWWEAAPGENLTLSVVWKPTFLPAADQFQLSIAVALAVRDWAATLLGDSLALRLKWPNDLYYQDQKLGGILIENTLNSVGIQSSIVGIGININQQQFAVPTATSIGVVTGRSYPLAPLVERLLEALERRYLQLRAGNVAAQQQEYLRVLYRYRQPAQYQAAGRLFQGIITGIEATGRLVVEENGQERTFGLQELRYC